MGWKKDGEVGWRSGLEKGVRRVGRGSGLEKGG